MGIGARGLLDPVVSYGRFVEEADVFFWWEVRFDDAGGMDFRVGFCRVTAGILQDD